MHILMTGAAGMIGRKLTARLIANQKLNGKPIERLTLLDVSASPADRWYRHVIYGWNIYSLYEGQPLPGLAEAIRLKDPARIAKETARIESALGRMRAALIGCCDR